MTAKKYALPATMLTMLLATAAPLLAASAASRDAFQAEEAQLRKVIARAVDAYVFIGGGSGAIISPDGYVITNNHVARGSMKWTIRNAKGKRFSAVIIGTTPATDLALLKITGAKNLPYLPLGDSDKLSPGDAVIAVGNPFALGNLDSTPTVTLGVVSATGINRPHAGDAVVTDTPINPGNSGGPLVNMKGELIGVNGQVSTRFGIRANTGSGYAISSNQVTRYLDALKKARGGLVMPGTIRGVRLNVDRFDAAKVVAVTPGSPAAKAGLKVEDLIVAVADWPVATVHELIAVAARFPAGRSVVLTLRRGGKQETVELELVTHDRAALGVIFERKNRTSLKVEAVIPDGPAAKAGIRPGDIIVQLGNARINRRQILQALILRARPGQRARVVVRRDGRNVSVTVRLASVEGLRKLLRQGLRKPKPKPKPTTQPAK